MKTIELTENEMRFLRGWLNCYEDYPTDSKGEKQKVRLIIKNIMGKIK